MLDGGVTWKLKDREETPIDKDVKINDLADALDTSFQSFSAMMRRDNFRVSELEKIAEALGWRIERIKERD